MAYATKDTVASILGRTEGEIDNIFICLADTMVDSILGRSFTTELSKEEYFDTEQRNVFFGNDIGYRSFPLSCWPIGSVTSVQLIFRNLNSNNVVVTTTKDLVFNNDYYVDSMPQGTIIRFDDEIELPIGKQCIKVSYTYGYGTVPADVEMFANYLAASLADPVLSIPTNSSGTPLSELEMGRYREKYANPDQIAKTKFGGIISQLQTMLEEKYKLWR